MGISTTPSASSGPLLEVKNLKTRFFTDAGVVHAVDGVDFTVHRGEVFGLVGESGCGKSVTGFSIMRLVDAPGRIVDGEILFEGRSLLGLPEKEMENLRGSSISMIFQQPHLLPEPGLYGRQPGRRGAGGSPENEEEAGAENGPSTCLKQVGIPDPEQRAGRLSPRDVRRAGPARDDRHGPGAQSPTTDCR